MVSDSPICQEENSSPIILEIGPWPAEQRVLRAENQAYRAAGRAAEYATLYCRLRHAARQSLAGREGAAESLTALIAAHESKLTALANDAWADWSRGW